METKLTKFDLSINPTLARQILAGEFDPGNRSLLESLLIGVRSVPHPLCHQARARLENLLGRHREARR